MEGSFPAGFLANNHELVYELDVVVDGPGDGPYSHSPLERYLGYPLNLIEVVAHMLYQYPSTTYKAAPPHDA